VNKLWIGLMGAALSASAAAEWTEIGGNESITFYADVATLDSSGGTKKMWTLVGSKSERKYGEIKFSSIKTQFEFDCPAQKVRQLETAFYAGPLADGERVAGYADTGDWEPIVEGTVKDGLAKIACETAVPKS
jgi:hypothetical protein